MRTRKITFELFSSDKGFDDSGRWPVALGQTSSFTVDIDFEWDEKSDIMSVAGRALEVYMKDKYPEMMYKISYWWWRD